jgi:hypothetical protein
MYSEIFGYDSFNDNNDKENSNLKKYDNGYAFITRKVLRNDGIKKNKKIDVYTTGDIGSKIRDAITGNYYTDVVGSANEKLYFKVGYSTGEIKTKNGSTSLFYVSPEQYEKHLGVDLNEKIKTVWHERQEMLLE